MDKNLQCISSCALLKRKIEYSGGVIASTEYFEAQQDLEIPIPGFIIIVSRRHVQRIDEFSPVERHAFMEFLYKIRKGMREALHIETVYLIQEEDAAHFHLWLFPRYAWMEKFGEKINSVDLIMKWASQNLKTEENSQKINETAEVLRRVIG